MRARSAVFCALVVFAACGGELPGDFIPPDAAPDAAPPARVPVMRIHSWPGQGLQLDVEEPDSIAAETPGGQPTAWLETAGGLRIDAVVAPAAVTTGLTAIVVLPSTDPTIHAARVAAADALLRALPPTERAALFVAREHAELLADLEVRRAHARDRLAALAPEAGTSATIPLREVRELLADAQSSHGDLGRTAIVIGDTGVDDPPEVRRVVQVLTMPVDASPGAAATAVVAQLLARRSHIVRIGACPTFAENTPFILHLGTGFADELYAPAVMDQVQAEPCVAAEAAADRYPYPSEIDVTFTPAERAIYDQAFAASDENVTFTTSVKLGVGTAITATGHLRGQGTLFCARKSLNLALDGPRRRLMPEVAASRFFLISMCQDDYYFGQVFGDRLLAKLDLFAPHTRFVKLKVDGVNQGIYLLMDQPDNSIHDNNLGLFSVLRRRYDIDNQPAEVKYPSDPEEAAQIAARFETLGDLAMTGPVETLDADLAARVDLDAYYRIIATYSLLQNGDYIDEFFFYGSSEAGGEHYRAMGWDTDDLFSPCHGGGGRGIVDRCGLTYCAEAELDHALLRSGATYNRFLTGLDDVLTQLTPTVMAATMAQVKAELWVALDDDETAAGMTEFGPLTLATARSTIAQRMDLMLTNAANDHAALLARRATCPLSPP